MTWTLLIVAITGILTPEAKLHSIPMMNKDACVNAAKTFTKTSKGVGFVCVSSETGEVIKVEQ